MATLTPPVGFNATNLAVPASAQPPADTVMPGAAAPVPAPPVAPAPALPPVAPSLTNAPGPMPPAPAARARAAVAPPQALAPAPADDGPPAAAAPPAPAPPAPAGPPAAAAPPAPVGPPAAAPPVVAAAPGAAGPNAAAPEPPDPAGAPAAPPGPAGPSPAAPGAAPAQPDPSANKVGGALNRIGDLFSKIENPYVEGGAAIGTSILAYANLPIIGTIVSGIYCLGHLFKFLGKCMSGQFDAEALRELAGALICGGAAVTTAFCPAIGMVNGVALTADMSLGILMDSYKQQQQASFSPPQAPAPQQSAAPQPMTS